MDAITPTTKERPILFSGAMVRAILKGRKTQTRRIIKPQPIVKQVSPSGDPLERKLLKLGFEKDGCIHLHHRQDECAQFCPYGQPGDRLWVRETTQADYEVAETITAAKYAADGAPVLYPGPEVDENGDDDYGGSHAHWWYSKDTCPNIHMPRWASRITLEIVSVRVERLQAISLNDAKAEGLGCVTKDGDLFKYGLADVDGLPGGLGWPWHEWKVNPEDAYRTLWDGVNGAGSWYDNPWVWVIEFKRVGW